MTESTSPQTAVDLFSVQGRAAIVTGASSGLGERFARVLAANGAKVLAVARRRERLDALAAEHPGVIVPHTADLANDQARAGLVPAALEHFGRLDVLVNNAGFVKSRPALEEPLDDFRAQIELNLVAVYDLARLAARHMVTQGQGSIINIASILGLVASSPMPGAAYTASKGGVVNVTRELGCQWARKGVRVNAIAPGYFLTEGTGEMTPGTPFGDYVHNNCPMRRIGAAHELDGVLLYLASDASSFCTGQTLTIDGGWTAR